MCDRDGVEVVVPHFKVFVGVCKFCIIVWAFSYFTRIYREMDKPFFEVVFHHRGKFINDGYVGETNTLSCDLDGWSYFEILPILKEMGYVNVKEIWYSVGEGYVFEGRLELLSDDKSACHMVNIGILNGQVHLYVVHMVSEPQIVHFLEYCGHEVGVEGQGDHEVCLDGGIANDA